MAREPLGHLAKFCTKEGLFATTLVQIKSAILLVASIPSTRIPNTSSAAASAASSAREAFRANAAIGSAALGSLFGHLEAGNIGKSRNGLGALVRSILSVRRISNGLVSRSIRRHGMG